MTTEQKIAPALTAEEWAKGALLRPTIVASIGRDLDDRLRLDISEVSPYRASEDVEAYDSVIVMDGDIKSLAALCLHDQPFGFTWADVEILEFLATETLLGPAGPLRLKPLADRIAALLPPRKEN